jgi:DNA-binding response OmpR family regulator
MTNSVTRSITAIARFGEFSLDFEKMELCRADEPVTLTLQEFKVLKVFVTKPEVVFSRLKLITSAWPKRKRSSHRTVDNCISKLRQKIEKDPTRPVFLLTVHGVGYKFVPRDRSFSVLRSDQEAEAENSTTRLMSPFEQSQPLGHSERNRK